MSKDNVIALQSPEGIEDPLTELLHASVSYKAVGIWVGSLMSILIATLTEFSGKPTSVMALAYPTVPVQTL